MDSANNNNQVGSGPSSQPAGHDSMSLSPQGSIISSSSTTPIFSSVSSPFYANVPDAGSSLMNNPHYSYVAPHNNLPVEDTWWPNVRAYICYPRHMHDPTVIIEKAPAECAVCQEELVIAGLPRKVHGNPGIVNVSGEKAVVLYCGHIVGRNCLERWYYSARDQEMHPACPICRRGTIACIDCKARLKEFLLPATVDEASHKVGDCPTHNCNVCNILPAISRSVPGHIAAMAALQIPRTLSEHTETCSEYFEDDGDPRRANPVGLRCANCAGLKELDAIWKARIALGQVPPENSFFRNVTGLIIDMSRMFPGTMPHFEDVIDHVSRRMQQSPWDPELMHDLVEEWSGLLKSLVRRNVTRYPFTQPDPRTVSRSMDAFEPESHQIGIELQDMIDTEDEDEDMDMDMDSVNGVNGSDLGSIDAAADEADDERSSESE